MSSYGSYYLHSGLYYDLKEPGDYAHSNIQTEYSYYSGVADENYYGGRYYSETYYNSLTGYYNHDVGYDGFHGRSTYRFDQYNGTTYSSNHYYYRIIAYGFKVNSGSYVFYQSDYGASTSYGEHTYDNFNIYGGSQINYYSNNYTDAYGQSYSTYGDLTYTLNLR